MATLRLGRTLTEAAGARELDVAGATIGAVFDELRERLPGVERRIRDETGVIRRHVAVFLDGSRVSDQSAALTSTSMLDVIPAVSGG